MKPFLTIGAMLVCSAAAYGEVIIALDDLDGTNTFLSREFEPDLSPSNTWSSDFDVFGIVDSTINFDFGGFTPGNFFIGAEDTDNPDNGSAPVFVAYGVPIAGYTDLMLGIEIAAAGDQEAGNNLFDISYSIDGGPEVPLLSGVGDSDDVGSMIVTGADSGFVSIDGSVFTGFTESIGGTGSTLDLFIDISMDGPAEVVAFDNVTVSGTLALIPEPSSLALLSVFTAGIVLRRRRR